jgi:hypothetical protein
MNHICFTFCIFKSSHAILELRNELSKKVDAGYVSEEKWLTFIETQCLEFEGKKKLLYQISYTI